MKVYGLRTGVYGVLTGVEGFLAGDEDGGAGAGQTGGEGGRLRWGLESCAQTEDPVPEEVTELWILERMELERISPVERVV